MELWIAVVINKHTHQAYQASEPLPREEAEKAVKADYEATPEGERDHWIWEIWRQFPPKYCVRLDLSIADGMEAPIRKARVDVFVNAPTPEAAREYAMDILQFGRIVTRSGINIASEQVIFCDVVEDN